VFENLVAGHGLEAEAALRKDFSCQQGRIYARLVGGSGKNRTKGKGNYVYKGHISTIATDIRWKSRLERYATRHKERCNYPHPDLERVGENATTGGGFGRDGIESKRSITGWNDMASLPVSYTAGKDRSSCSDL
jgi:hypothetical protein